MLTGKTKDSFKKSKKITPVNNCIKRGYKKDRNNFKKNATNLTFERLYYKLICIAN
jgi:hypothetical protein